MIKPSGAVRGGKLRGRGRRSDRDRARCSPSLPPKGEVGGRALGRAAVWKNCSSFTTVFRSSVPSTVFHAPLCFPNGRPPLARAGGPDRSHPPLASTPLNVRASSARLRTANFSLLSLLRTNERTKRQRPARPGRIPLPLPPLSLSLSLSFS